MMQTKYTDMPGVKSALIELAVIAVAGSALLAIVAMVTA